MKNIALLFAMVSLVCGAFAAGDSGAQTAETTSLQDAPPEWRGMLVVGDQRRFSLTTPGGSESAWIAIGGSFNDWELVEYREKPESILLRKEGLDLELSLSGSEIVTAEADSAAVVAQAESLLRQMNFEGMLQKILEQQKTAMVTMTRQSLAQDPNMRSVDPDEFADFQQKMMDVMWNELNPEQLGIEMAAAYAEVFTPAEMQGMAEFYATPAGQASMEKAPQLQERMMQSMMPRMMAAMPKIRQMAQEFAAGQRAKNESGPQAPVPPAPPTLAP